MARCWAATNCPRRDETWWRPRAIHARDNPLLSDVHHRPGGGPGTKNPTLKQEDASMLGFVIHPDLLWLAVAFVTVMAGMLAAAPE